ncbi:hypothetical protein A2272_05815 [Candidatus Peregrinibacteria bacterium RIFOXYA12_FULL_33_12]|nr:MAG: hypothetical protein A2272_05815 [Candidatus Peregrinibacteria bacterium RIFOXYA12_FULL_33_12]
MPSISTLIKSGKTIFTTKELSDLWDVSYDSTKTSTLRKIKNEEFIYLKRGIFALSENYNKYELACKIMHGSYISLYTVLKDEGVIFQEFRTIYLIGTRAKEILIKNIRYEYHTIQNILYLTLGVKFYKNYSIATKERAILDSFFLFDTDFSDFNINSFDTELFLKLSKFYNKKTQKKAKIFLEHFNLI